MVHSISCSCGKLQGQIKHIHNINRCVCYCADCQAFARYLNKEEEVLDEQGGTSIVQTIPENVVFSQGIENLACIRLSDRGLLRWYAACCHTPIGNTPPDAKFSFVGLVYSCLGSDQNVLDETFGSIKMYVHTADALGENKPKSQGTFLGTLRILGMILKARLTGAYKNTPFFVSGSTSTSIATPKVLSENELAEAMKVK
ncbi:hypothetical protein Xen7305DRAFT_00020160 [Xenococcus sp. PCC 7305]|uniref:DUF6151 family protein n=1 Tax=Xenococcus sp. PCC 7305 TaxID=102125 RepID=UPI0002ACE27E|nr:DUF6151 family protein [Xenococcus sp. PCC 7305]ELS02303.1 hypothetical protein Xen7305DRAFT_00020160 [Xenococcus sp. PCC 7305]